MTQEDVDRAFNQTEPCYNARDCDKIRAVAEKVLHVSITRAQAESIWLEYSESMAAGWMHVPEDNADSIAQAIVHYIESRI